jgi:hypothetical protein
VKADYLLLVTKRHKHPIGGQLDAARREMAMMEIQKIVNFEIGGGLGGCSVVGKPLSRLIDETTPT